MFLRKGKEDPFFHCTVFPIEHYKYKQEDFIGNIDGLPRSTKKYENNKKDPILSLSNFNIRIVNIILMQWVRSTYFFFC